MASKRASRSKVPAASLGTYLVDQTGIESGPGIGLPARSRQVASETDVEIGSHFAVTQDPSVTATLRSPVRRDSGETYQEFLTRLAQASGIETPTRADLARLDRKRPKKAQFSVTPLMEQSVEVWP